VTLLLAADVGNTQINFGVFRDDALVRVWRTTTVHERTEDELAVFLDGFLEREELSLTSLDAAVIGSVVPPLTTAFQRLGNRYLRTPPFIVGPGIRTGVRLRVENPAEVGADRIANTLAAHRVYGGPAIVVDFGTSTNFDCVSAEGDFLGGAFAPGVEVASETLFSRAARLFRVPLTPPKEAIGRNTAACLQSGIVFGYVGLVEGLVARLRAEMSGDAKVIATGGLASTIVPHTKAVDTVDDSLTLQGLRLLWQLNR
jgi:type III pantothenate kinase